jgi:acyl carrier protein
MSDPSERLKKIASELSQPTQILQTVKGPARLRPDQVQAFVSPRTETEGKLAAIWAEAMGLQTVGIHDDFFELGGHSLMAMEVLSRIREMFGVEVPLSVLYRQPLTVAELAREVELAQIAGARSENITAVLDAVGRLSDQEVEAALARRQVK